MKIYISGPITGIKGYMEKFKAAEHKLTEMGYTVINSARVNAQLSIRTAHITSAIIFFIVLFLFLCNC